MSSLSGSMTAPQTPDDFERVLAAAAPYLYEIEAQIRIDPRTMATEYSAEGGIVSTDSVFDVSTIRELGFDVGDLAVAYQCAQRLTPPLFDPVPDSIQRFRRRCIQSGTIDAIVVAVLYLDSTARGERYLIRGVGQRANWWTWWAYVTPSGVEVEFVAKTRING